MKYTIVFTLLGLYLAVVAFLLEGWGWLLLWPALSFLLLGLAYAGLGSALLGKQTGGSLAWWAVLLLLPYLLITWGIWHVQRRVSREPVCNEVVSGVWIGRRPLAHELPDGVNLVVDLTAEFPVCRGVRRGRQYRCLPTLDASVPPVESFRRLVDEVARWPGVVFIHCAAGHGRTAMFAAALLVAKGLAADIDGAETMLRSVRPRVRILPVQRRFLMVARS